MTCNIAAGRLDSLQPQPLFCSSEEPSSEDVFVLSSGESPSPPDVLPVVPEDSPEVSEEPPLELVPVSESVSASVVPSPPTSNACGSEHAALPKRSVAQTST